MIHHNSRLGFPGFGLLCLAEFLEQDTSACKWPRVWLSSRWHGVGTGETGAYSLSTKLPSTLGFTLRRWDVMRRYRRVVRKTKQEASSFRRGS